MCGDRFGLRKFLKSARRAAIHLHSLTPLCPPLHLWSFSPGIWRQRPALILKMRGSWAACMSTNAAETRFYLNSKNCCGCTHWQHIARELKKWETKQGIKRKKKKFATFKKMSTFRPGKLCKKKKKQRKCYFIIISVAFSLSRCRILGVFGGTILERKWQLMNRKQCLSWYIPPPHVPGTA